MRTEQVESEEVASDIEDDFEISMQDGLQVSIEHNDPDDWLAELRITVLSCGDRTVRLCVDRVRREDASDVFVIGGYFDEDGILCELIYRCEQVDYHGLLFEGTDEAKELVVKLKASCRDMAAAVGVSISLLGGRFKAK